MQASLEKPTCLRSSLLVALLVVTLVATWTNSTRLNGIRLRPTHEQLSPRFTWYAIPIALSQLVYEHDHDYTGYASVSLVFSNPEARGKSFKFLLAEAATLDEAAVRSSPTWIIPADDKGLVDFTWLAFRLFGVQVKSLNAMFFLVLVAGSSLFVVDNFQRPARLALLVFLLASLYSATFMVRVTDQFGTVFEPRVFDLLSLIPALQLLSIIVDRRRATPWTLSLASADVFLLLFIYHARATVGWQMLLLWVCNLAVWLICGSSGVKAARVIDYISTRALSLIRLGWPSILVVAGLCCLQGYKWLSYHPLYFQKHDTAHVFWHNALMGLVCNPYLAERYGLSQDDVHTMQAVQTYLRERGDEQTCAAIYGDPRSLHTNFATFDWVHYEPVARDLYAELWARHPGEMAWTYVYHKPAAFFITLLWAMGWPMDNCTLPAALGSPADDGLRVEYDLYFNPLRWEVVGLDLAAFLTALPFLRSGAKGTFLLAAVTLVFSAIPGVLVMPVIPYVNTTLVLAATAFYIGSAWGFIVALEFIKKRCGVEAMVPGQSFETIH